MNTKKPKHIDAVVKYFYPVAAGIETNMLETYSVLAKKGWDVTIHTSTDTLIEKNVLKQKETISGLSIKRYPYSLFGFWPTIDWAHTDLVALHNFNLFPHTIILFYSLVLKLLNKKRYGLVLTPHGGFTPEWSIFPIWQTLLKYIPHFTIGTFLINYASDKVRAVSKWENNQIVLKGVNPDKLFTITNGIENEADEDMDKLASKKVKEKVKNYGKYLIQIGRVYPIKNYETVIKALPNITSDVNYVIAGPIQENETYLKYLQDLATSLDVGKRVLFVGVIRGLDKYYLVKHAQMMVHMAKWESFCNVVNEGMSQGLPCIVANNTALPLLIKNGINGYCVDTYDSKTLAEKINFVLQNSNSDFIKEMKERNKKLGLETSWSKVADKVDRLYKSLL